MSSTFLALNSLRMSLYLPRLLRLPPLPLPSLSTTLLISLMCLRTLRRIWGEKSSLKSLRKMRHRMRPRTI